MAWEGGALAAGASAWQNSYCSVIIIVKEKLLLEMCH